ncbi:DUF2996 domain-containing protein [Synechococcus sp. PCC 7336]|uniref:DUF2996 domain-containing protein n=1 Tax=Synechococcus sp. PCC 7336 TaxID=195250 RepID=UPI0003458036|nr:DUF2996 domain-containing protein [Synechococcus sp. PCC 7336]
MAEESKPVVSESKPAEDKTAKPSASQKPAAKKKKAKEPEKPFEQAIAEDVIPGTVAAFKARGVDDLELVFEDSTLKGKFAGDRREFNVIFSEPELTASKAFTCTTDRAPISTVESFMIDERKAPAELIVFYIVQRIYAQQWI